MNSVFCLVQDLRLFQLCEFFDEFFLPESGETDGELYIIAAALASQNEPAAVFFVPDVGTGYKALRLRIFRS